MSDREPPRGDRLEWLMIAALVVMTIAGAAAAIGQIGQAVLK